MYLVFVYSRQPVELLPGLGEEHVGPQVHAPVLHCGGASPAERLVAVRPKPRPARLAVGSEEKEAWAATEELQI